MCQRGSNSITYSTKGTHAASTVEGSDGPAESAPKASPATDEPSAASPKSTSFKSALAAAGSVEASTIKGALAAGGSVEALAAAGSVETTAGAEVLSTTSEWGALAASDVVFKRFAGRGGNPNIAMAFANTLPFLRADEVAIANSIFLWAFANTFESKRL